MTNPTEHDEVWWSQMYVGICPRCHEEKFIGHGPLCVDCYLTPDEESSR